MNWNGYCGEFGNKIFDLLTGTTYDDSELFWSPNKKYMIRKGKLIYNQNSEHQNADSTYFELYYCNDRIHQKSCNKVWLDDVNDKVKPSWKNNSVILGSKKCRLDEDKTVCK